MSRMRFYPSKSDFLAADWAGFKDYLIFVVLKVSYLLLYLDTLPSLMKGDSSSLNVPSCTASSHSSRRFST